jgi:hypothetical protein
MVEETSMKVRCVSWGLSSCCNVQGDNEVMLDETFYGQQDIDSFEIKLVSSKLFISWLTWRVHMTKCHLSSYLAFCWQLVTFLWYVILVVL